MMLKSLIVFLCLTQLAIAKNSFSLPADYQLFTADEKQNLLWDFVNESQYAPDKLPTSGPSIFDILKLLNAKFLSKSFTHQSDLMQKGRKKLVHPLGSVAKARFIPATFHLFGGLYRQEVPLIIRLSTASANSFIPGIAVKFLRDSKASLNVVAMKGLESVEPNCNPFGFEFSNIIPKPSSGLFKTLLSKFQKGVELAHGKGTDATNLKVSHLAKEDNFTGLYPYELIFKPSRATTLKTNFSCDRDWRNVIRELRPQETIYLVKGRLLPETKPVTIGKIILESDFVASKFGDEQLYFQHFTEK